MNEASLSKGVTSLIPQHLALLALLPSWRPFIPMPFQGVSGSLRTFKYIVCGVIFVLPNFSDATVLAERQPSTVDAPSHPEQYSQLTDPYSILSAHYTAVGGLERLKSEKTSYMQGTIRFAQMVGKLQVWEEGIRYRREAHYRAFSQVEGDNGRHMWSVDLNRKHLIHKDPETVKRRKIRGLLEDFENFNPYSEFFTLSFMGIQEVNGEPCYVIETRNTINRDIYYDYFSVQTFLLLKEIIKEPYLAIETFYTDFRKLNEMTYSFRSESEIAPTGKKIVIQIEELVINIPIDSDKYELPEHDVRDFTFANNINAESIPFAFVENNIFLPVALHGETHYWVLDSGADMSVIDADYADSLGLIPKGVLRGNATSSLAEFSFVNVDAYQVPGLEFHDQTILSYRGLASKFYEPEIVGILGYDFLSRVITKIDYSNRQISFYDPETFVYQGHGHRVEASLQNRLFMLTMGVNEAAQGRFGLDLGSFDVTLNYRFARKHGFLKNKGIKRFSSDLSGMFYEQQIKTQSIEIAGYQVRNELISFPLTEGIGTNSNEELDGLIGNTLLRHFTLYLDYKNQQLIFEKGVNFGQEFPVDNSGMTIGLSPNNQAKIFLVAHNTPAHHAGLLAGDIIIGINALEGAMLPSIVQIKKLFQAESGTIYTLKILRDAQPMMIQLQLKELYE